MPINSVINTITTVEKILCIYRNYSTPKKGLIVKLRTFCELTLLFFVYVFYVAIVVTNKISKIHKNSFLFILLFCYITLALINTVVAIILGSCTSEQFQEFVSNMNAVHGLYKYDLLYQNRVKKLTTRFHIHLFIFAALIITLAALQMYEISRKDQIAIVYLFSLVHWSMMNRYFYENLVFYELIECVMVPLGVLESKACATAQELLDADDGARSVIYWPGVQREVERWETVYRHLVDVARNLSDSFSVQISLSVFSVAFYFISLLYQAIYYVAHSDTKLVDEKRISSLSLVMFMCGLSILCIARAGQHVEDKTQQLQRKLAVFRSVLILIPDSSAAECARVAGALWRRMRAAPLRVRLLGALPVRMALLANMLAIVVDYTVITVQFNHVV